MCKLACGQGWSGVLGRPHCKALQPTLDLFHCRSRAKRAKASFRSPALQLSLVVVSVPVARDRRQQLEEASSWHLASSTSSNQLGRARFPVPTRNLLTTTHLPVRLS